MDPLEKHCHHWPLNATSSLIVYMPVIPYCVYRDRRTLFYAWWWYAYLPRGDLLGHACMRWECAYIPRTGIPTVLVLFVNKLDLLYVSNVKHRVASEDV